MKKLASSSIVALVLLLSGCVAPVGKLTSQVFDQVGLVRDEFNALLPSDFRGPLEISRTDSFFTISLKAANIHKTETGEWSWDWVEYERLTHFPSWSSNVHFKIGAPK